ncbi:WD repeat-containing protein 54 isoform 3-T3 [Amazona ochrocephala]
MAAAVAEYRREQSLPLPGSSAALYNNLSVLRLPGPQPQRFSAVHGPSLSLLSAAAAGLGLSHRQLPAREPGMGLSAALLTQAAWCVLPSRVLLVLTSQKGIQMYEADGSVLVYWHALDVAEHPPAQAVFARGIAAVGERFICVGRGWRPGERRRRRDPVCVERGRGVPAAAPAPPWRCGTGRWPPASGTGRSGSMRRRAGGCAHRSMRTRGGSMRWTWHQRQGSCSRVRRIPLFTSGSSAGTRTPTMLRSSTVTPSAFPTPRSAAPASAIPRATPSLSPATT